MELQNNKSQTEIRQALRQQILNFQPTDFERLALDIFRYQATYNPVYNQYIHHLNIRPERVTRLTEIPFLPVQFFKNHIIKSSGDPSGGDPSGGDPSGGDPSGGDPSATSIIFQSSGTTGQQTSRHHLFDETLYKTVSARIFQENFGDLKQFHILALLPSYLERNNSSLVYMMQHFIDESQSDFSGFYLNNIDEMLERLTLMACNPDGRKVLLLGVTFALLDLAESEHDLSSLSKIKDLTIMDTGGMKGRRQELLREEVHDTLTSKLFVDKIHSEYGMTEMLSQGYSQGAGLLVPGFSMRILLRDINDPFAIYDHNINTSKTGGINVIDLANLDSCSFIETQDLGRFGEKGGSFYVMGRFDNSDIRGCNLMVM